jgi:two-component system LytT family response regulator
LARDGIRQVLQREADIEVVGEAGDGQRAIKSIQELNPDVVFLDIQMPGCDGLEVIRQVTDEYLPLFVFVTAHDKHAVEAFDLDAVDYVLKPITPHRLQEALRRVRLDLSDERSLARRHGGLVDIISRRSEEPSGATNHVTRFAVRKHDRYIVLKCAQVSWIESAGNYVQIHAGNQSYLMRATMAELEERLDPDIFVRAHRTAIVNLNRIREVIPLDHGDHTINLDDGTAVRLSRGCRDRVFACLYRGQHGDD